MKKIKPIRLVLLREELEAVMRSIDLRINLLPVCDEKRLLERAMDRLKGRLRNKKEITLQED